MEEELRHFAVLDSTNTVINIFVLSKNPDPTEIEKWNGNYIWIYDGSMWNSLSEQDSMDYAYSDENVNFVDQIVGDSQEYLNSQFPTPELNDIVINRENLPTIDLVVQTPEELLLNPEDSYTLQEYSLDNSITNTPGSVEYTYNEELNAFIPPQDDPTYILNTETFEWEPNPNIDYDLNGDGIMYRWDGENWILSSEV